MRTTYVHLLVSVLVFHTSLTAQMISIKTVPVTTGDQFLIFPSRTTAMGGVSIAVDDPFLDPFDNPAKGVGITGSSFMASPVYYRISDDNGSARTLPLGIQLKKSRWFGGVYVSAQNLDVTNQNSFATRLDEKSMTNMYSNVYAGFPLGTSGYHLGGSVFYADLRGMDGVELLYPNSSRIQQNGELLDVKIGLFRKTEDREFEAILVYHDFEMIHEVHYGGWWQWESWFPFRQEEHTDHSRTWGVHLGYTRPLYETGWKVGGMATLNMKTHPKIPNYELMNIPRDPGDSWAYNLGVGFSKETDETLFGIDLIYEPIWSTTWATTLNEATTRSGRTIPAGGKTVENEFTFSNVLLRFGLTHGRDGRGFQFGLQSHTYEYWLDQYDYLDESRRKQTESWTEWVISWGWFRQFEDFELRYMGRMITGVGRPGVDFMLSAEKFAAAGMNDILLAPNGPLTLDETPVFTHQICLIIPLSRF